MIGMDELKTRWLADIGEFCTRLSQCGKVKAEEYRRLRLAIESGQYRVIALVNQFIPDAVVAINGAYGRTAPLVLNQVAVEPHGRAPVLGEEVAGIELEIAVIVAEALKLTIGVELRLDQDVVEDVTQGSRGVG
jgi:hypothetical protein